MSGVRTRPGLQATARPARAPEPARPRGTVLRAAAVLRLAAVLLVAVLLVAVLLVAPALPTAAAAQTLLRLPLDCSGGASCPPGRTSTWA